MEAGKITGDEIEFFFGGGQVEARPNAMHHALHPKKRQGVAKNRLLIDVQSNSAVAELLCDIKKEAGTTTEIEKVTARAASERKNLHTFAVAFYPNFAV